MKKLISAAALIFGMAFFAVSAQADSLPLDTVISGATPTGSPPWAVAELSGMEGGTALTMTAHFAGNEFIGSWYFDLVPGLTLGSDDFTYEDATGVSRDVDVVFLNEKSAQNRAGVSGFDFYFDFPTRPNARFEDGEWAKFTIAGVSPADFTGSLAHIQNIGDDSGWIGGGNGANGGNGAPPVPEPATLLLVGVGLGLAGLKKKMA